MNETFPVILMTRVDRRTARVHRRAAVVFAIAFGALAPMFAADPALDSEGTARAPPGSKDAGATPSGLPSYADLKAAIAAAYQTRVKVLANSTGKTHLTIERSDQSPGDAPRLEKGFGRDLMMPPLEAMRLQGRGTWTVTWYQKDLKHRYDVNIPPPPQKEEDGRRPLLIETNKRITVDPAVDSSIAMRKAKVQQKPLTLETIRQNVAANEVRLNPIRLRFTTTFETKGEPPEPKAGFRKPGRRFSHVQCEWAQKGEKHYAELSYFFSPDELWQTMVYVIDETNWTSAVLPHWSSRSIRPREKLKWNADIQVTTLGLRPFEGDYPLSQVLEPPWAAFSGQMEEIDGKRAAVVEAKRRAINPEEPPYYARIWIDVDRGIVLRMRNFDSDATAKDRHPLATIDQIQHQQLANGDWLPVEGTRTLHFPDRTSIERIKVDADSIALDPKDIPDSLFSLDAPSKTKTRPEDNTTSTPVLSSPARSSPAME